MNKDEKKQKESLDNKTSEVEKFKSIKKKNKKKYQYWDCICSGYI